MTVNPATRMWSGDEIESTLSDNFRSLDLKTSRMYAVTCTPDVEGLAILNATGIPVPGELLPGTSNVYAHQAKANRISPVLWHVTVPYKGFVPQISGSTSPFDIQRAHALAGKSIASSQRWVVCSPSLEAIHLTRT